MVPTPAVLLAALLLVAPVVLLLTARSVSKRLVRDCDENGWSWETMRGTAPLPAPRWRDGVFIQQRRNRNPALCLRFTLDQTPSEVFEGASRLREPSIRWVEPALFHIEALFEPPPVSFASGMSRLRLRLREHRSTDDPTTSRTVVHAVFESVSAGTPPHRALDDMHLALDTPLHRAYAERGLSSAQMRSIEQVHRASAVWAQELLSLCSRDDLVATLDGANLADLVSRRL